MGAAIDTLKRKPRPAEPGTAPLPGRLADNELESAFEQHWGRICAMLTRLLGDPAEAEDLALETFWRLHRSPPAQPNPTGLGGWLYRVALNLGYNALRADQRRLRYEEQAGRLDSANGLPLSTQVEQAAERRLVRQVLAELNPRAAQILMLRYSGLSYAEIASAVQVAPGSVGTLLARAEKDFEQRYQAVQERS